MEKICKKTFIGIYHKDCADGAAAGAVLLKKFPGIALFPVNHSDNDINEIVEKARKVAEDSSEIYFADITFGLEELLKSGCKITVIDHHISEKKRVEKLASENKNITFIFNNDKSGASLAWKHFFPEENMPEIIKYIEDSDLWKGKYGDDTKYVVNYLSISASSPEKMLEFIENSDIEDIKKKGKIIASYTSVQMDRIVKNAKSINLRIGDMIIPAYNLTLNEYVSFTGNKLSAMNKKTAVMFSINGDSVKFSMRSADGQNPSALTLAKLLGGGGHENAAGAEISLKDFLKMIVQ